MMSNEARPSSIANGIHAVHVASGGYGPPGGYGGPPGGGYPPPGGGGYGGPPQGGPPGGGGFGPPAPPGGGGYGGAPPGGFGGPPQGYGGGGFGPPGGFPPPGGPMMPGMGGDVNTTLPLILNIIGALFCGTFCVTFILSVLGIVFAVQAGSSKNTGDIETARAKAKTSMLMFAISAALGFVGYVVAIIVRVANS